MTSLTPISDQIWNMKYRLKDQAGAPLDNTIEDTFKRIATALAQPETPDRRQNWAGKFYDVMASQKFLPAGRILAGAGADRNVTLFNCFVMGAIPDDLGGIFESLKEAALTLQQGGGIGYDFSTLRPKGALVQGVGADASGPLSFMDVWDSMCRTIMSAGSRRGAMMAVLACDHPDIEAFVDAKSDPDRLRMFNLSVLVTNGFMDAVQSDAEWPLTFDGKIYRRINARALWNRIMKATYDYAEPGVIFIDRINQQNNLNYCETISATNPCGEQPLPPYGACLLGSINLAQLVRHRFSDNASIDLAELEQIVGIAVRMLDNAIEVSGFPLEAQQQEAYAKRRIGLGVTGLADAFLFCSAAYGSAKSIELTELWLKAIQDAAYHTSAKLAGEKGAFPLFEIEAYQQTSVYNSLGASSQALIKNDGLRNALLTSIAPTGTISLFANNVSSGIEPVFAYNYDRAVLMEDGSKVTHSITDFGYQAYLDAFGHDAPAPDYFSNVASIEPVDHLAIQAAAQKFVDSSISKTINVPQEIAFDDFKDVYVNAWRLGLKGCTTYRPNDVTGAVLSAQAAEPKHPAPAPRDGVVYMTQPLDRPETLEGLTYKIRWPDSDHATYITLNDIVQDGRRRPFEIFINSKNMEHYAWTLALTRMISAVFRRGGDVTFVVEELKAVFDPRGGQWMNGRYVPSLLAAIGEVIEEHLLKTGFLGPSEIEHLIPAEIRAEIRNEIKEAVGAEHRDGAQISTISSRNCPKCFAPTLVRIEACDTCMSCGYSRCA
jgi:ribonucleoside-diphosphate reductase alpha chain